MAEPRTDFLMAKIRKSRGLSLEAVAAVVGTDQGNLSRVEKGMQIPKRELARSLYEYYRNTRTDRERRLPLAAIYDPEFHAANKR